jgi:acyl-CoA dehydrogenase
VKFLTRHVLLPWFQKHLPSVSAEEKTVLASGGLWFEKEFFTGQPDWQALFDLPKPSLNAEEQHFLSHEVDALCALVDDWQVSHEADNLPEVAWDYIKAQGFWGLTLPQAVGGHGFTALAHSAIIAKLASCSMALAYTVMVPNSLGLAAFIQNFGTQPQKDRYLPRLASGQEISCFALTTPRSGSDATSISDTGIICQGLWNGEDVLGIKLNFEKRYITLAPIATLIGLAFRLSDPDHLLADISDYGISIAIVPSHLDGIRIGERHQPFGLGFMNGPIYGEDVFIPLDYLIGGMAYAGEGWQMMLSCLSLGRGISLPALSTGITQTACRISSAYAMIRQQFKTNIGAFEGVQSSLARITAFNYCCESTRLLTALGVAAGKRPAVAAAISKYHLTEMAQRVVIDAMDILGGAAIQLGPRNRMANLYLATQMNRSVEGANILTRNLMIYGQGVLRCHPNLQDLIQAAQESVSDFQRLFYRQLRFSARAFIRGGWQGMTGGCWIAVPKHPYAKLMRQLSRISNVLVVLTEVSLLCLGKKMKRAEAISARLGDLLSYLYLAAGALKHFEDSGRPEDDEAVLEWCLCYCLYEIDGALTGIFSSFPQPFIAGCLRRLLFPWGLRYNYPSDQLSQQVARRIQQDFSWRERMTQLCYHADVDGDVIDRMDQALKAVLEDHPEAEALRAAVIKVDTF